MKRLEAIGNLVPDGSVLVDVGTDHAYLIVDLILKVKYLMLMVSISMKTIKLCT